MLRASDRGREVRLVARVGLSSWSVLELSGSNLCFESALMVLSIRSRKYHGSPVDGFYIFNSLIKSLNSKVCPDNAFIRVGSCVRSSLDIAVLCRAELFRRMSRAAIRAQESGGALQMACLRGEILSLLWSGCSRCGLL